MTKTPVPRFDLIDFKNYVHLNVQFSRGCPFLCEFCDIIELYGRKPRAKNNAQMIAELDRIFALGFRGHVDFVDDNLIGNKKAVKAFLPELIAWQKAKGYPFEFTTEASLNIADDPEFLDLMRDANFFAMFIGIESPDPKVLALAQKKQNTRREIAASIHKIYKSGMFVIAGFIVGFDDESDEMAPELVTLIDEASIPVSMVGLLYALPNTQLTRRLAKEGRLHPDHDIANGKGADQFLSGLNFDSTRPPRDVLTGFPRRRRRHLRDRRLFPAGHQDLFDARHVRPERQSQQLELETGPDGRRPVPVAHQRYGAANAIPGDETDLDAVEKEPAIAEGCLDHGRALRPFRSVLALCRRRNRWEARTRGERRTALCHGRRNPSSDGGDRLLKTRKDLSGSVPTAPSHGRGLVIFRQTQYVAPSSRSGHWLGAVRKAVDKLGNRHHKMPASRVSALDRSRAVAFPSRPFSKGFREVDEA